MARRTYLPTFHAILRRLERYIDRYDVDLVNNLPPDRKTLFDAIQLAVKSYLNNLDAA